VPARDNRNLCPGLPRFSDDPRPLLGAPAPTTLRTGQDLSAHLMDVLQHVLKDVLSRQRPPIYEGRKTTLTKQRLFD